jgi:hypothetical protein
MLGANLTSGAKDEVITGFGKADKSFAQVSVGDGQTHFFAAFNAYKWPGF